MSQSQGSYVTKDGYVIKAIGEISIDAIDNFDGTVVSYYGLSLMLDSHLTLLQVSPAQQSWRSA